MLMWKDSSDQGDGHFRMWFSCVSKSGTRFLHHAAKALTARTDSKINIPFRWPILINHSFIQQTRIKKPTTLQVVSQVLRIPRQTTTKNILKKIPGTSQVVQWLGLCTSMRGAQVQSLVGELTSHMLRSLTKKNPQNLFLKWKKKKIPVVQWLGLCTFIAEDADSIPGHGAKIL